MWATIGKILASLISSKSGINGEGIQKIGGNALTSMGHTMGSWAKAIYGGNNSAKSVAEGV